MKKEGEIWKTMQFPRTGEQCEILANHLFMLSPGNMDFLKMRNIGDKTKKFLETERARGKMVIWYPPNVVYMRQQDVCPSLIGCLQDPCMFCGLPNPEGDSK